MNWQPIETAPKDGTDVLLWSKEDDTVTIGWFGPNGYTLKDHWHGITSYADNPPDFNIGIIPTHWMPLPEPPEAQP